jgi:tetratricopeptide (TPR) repeat protein
LGPDEHDLACLLSVCRGGCSLGMAEQLWFDLSVTAKCPGRDRNSVPALLDSLASKSLIERGEIQGVSRFQMLETIREFAAERLEKNGLHHEVERILAANCLQLARTIEPQLRGRTQDTCFEMLEMERANLAIALTRFISDKAVADALGLCSALHWFWYRKGHFSEGSMTLRQALGLLEDSARSHQCTPEVPPRVVIDARHAYGWLLFVQGNWKNAAEQFSACAVEARACCYDEGEARALSFLGVAERWLGDKETGYTHCMAGLDTARKSGNELSIASALVWAYATVGGRGLDEKSRQGLEEALALSRRTGELWLEAHALEGLGDLYREQERYIEAAVHYEAALDSFRRLDDSWMTAWSLEGLGRTLLQRGRPHESVLRLGEAFRLFLALGDRENAAFILGYAALAAFSGGYGEIGARLMGCCRRNFKQGEGAIDSNDIAAYEGATTLSRNMYTESWTRGCLDELEAAESIIATIADEKQTPGNSNDFATPGLHTDQPG